MTSAPSGSTAETGEQTKLYITGPMTGLPEFNYPAFYAAALELQAGGYMTENPADAFDGATDMPWATYLKRDIHALLECDGLATLDGWEKSKGATLECHIATTLGMPVLSVDDWLFAGSPPAVSSRGVRGPEGDTT